VGIDTTFLDAVFGRVEGYAHVAVGHGATSDQAGKYCHQTWQQLAFSWPYDADTAVKFMDDVLAQDGRDDIYVCPNILSTERRLKGTAVTHRLLHADADSGADASKIKALEGFAVASGSHGHAQVYVPSACDLPLGQYAALQQGMRAYFGGDNKISDNDLLRPVGSFNYKAVVLHGLAEPYPVEWIVMPSPEPMPPEVIARILGIDLAGLETVRAQSSSAKPSDLSRGAGNELNEEPFDLDLYPDIRMAIETTSGDRSADTYTIIAAGFRAGLKLSEIRWAVSRCAELRDRLLERNDDDVARIFCKLADADQPRKVLNNQYLEKMVEAEFRRLRVRAVARKRWERESQGPAEAFDAGLLQNILDRPPEDPYRIFGLLPSNAGLLVVAQRKAGKTTLTLNLALSLITGAPFLSTFGVRLITGRVALLNFEVSWAQLANWAHEVGVPPDRLFMVNLRGRRNPLNHPEDRARLAALLRDYAVETLIIDPFGRACGTTNQNDSGEVSAWLVDLDRFARSEVGAVDLILTAHAGWNAERSRGSSALEDWADSVITMTRDERGDGARYFRAIGRDVQVEEDRLDYDPITRLLSLAGSGSRKQNLKASKADALVDPVVAYVGTHSGASVSDIINALRQTHHYLAAGFAFQNNDVREACRLAEKRGQLRREPGGPGKATRHFLVSQELPETQARPSDLVGRGRGS
jgi:hypothetical protein